MYPQCCASMSIILSSCRTESVPTPPHSIPSWTSNSSFPLHGLHQVCFSVLFHWERVSGQISGFVLFSCSFYFCFTFPFLSLSSSPHSFFLSFSSSSSLLLHSLTSCLSPFLHFCPLGLLDGDHPFSWSLLPTPPHSLPFSPFIPSCLLSIP